MNQPWTFGIVYGNRPIFLNKIIMSIRQQNIPEYEIILVGDSSLLPHIDDETNIKKINFNENILPMWITKKKNIIAQVAQYENLSIHHDYVSLGDKWYKNFNKFGYDWDVAMTRIEQINGMRYRDWVRWDPVEYLDYKNNTETQNMYVSGSYFCIKKQFFLNNPFDERITWGHGEDVEWSKRIRSFWKYKCNWKSKVQFCKPKDCYPPDETDLSRGWYNQEINDD
jgi:hypothetical protein